MNRIVISAAAVEADDGAHGSRVQHRDCPKDPHRGTEETRGAKLILQVIADFDDVGGTPPGFSSDRSLSGQKQFKFCKPKKRKRGG